VDVQASRESAAIDRPSESTITNDRDAPVPGIGQHPAVAPSAWRMWLREPFHDRFTRVEIDNHTSIGPAKILFGPPRA
jgi:hypothetical protein